MNGTVFIFDPSDSLMYATQTALSREKTRLVVVSGRTSTLRRIADERPNTLIVSHGGTSSAGLHLVREALKTDPGLSVIAYLKSPHPKLVNAALKSGTHYLMHAPTDADEVRETVRSALVLNDLHRTFTPAASADQRSGMTSRPIFLGTSPAMMDTWNMVARIARTNGAVLIEGESGAGKEFVARAVHNASPRAARPFVTVNCGRLDAHTAESELFGHTQGAYTGAMKGRAGLFEQADTGTLFLDEISEMPLDVQVKLLRILESGRFRRMGGNQTVTVDVRPVFASNKNLQECVNRGEFREDLFHRINLLPVTVPPLRGRPEDVVPLAWHFIGSDAGDDLEGWEMTEEAMAALRDHDWPGNVRELRNTLRRACILATDRIITADLLPFHQARPALQPTSSPARKPSSLPLWVVERAHIQDVMSMVGGNKSRAALILEIDRKTLYSKLEKYGLLPSRLSERMTS